MFSTSASQKGRDSRSPSSPLPTPAPPPKKNKTKKKHPKLKITTPIKNRKPQNKYTSMHMKQIRALISQIKISKFVNVKKNKSSERKQQVKCGGGTRGIFVYVYDVPHLALL